MQQKVLDLHRIEEPTLDNFLAGRNGEALACLRAWRDAPAARTDPVRLVHLWGAPGCGRTHLALASAGEDRILAATAPPDVFRSTVGEWIAGCTGSATGSTTAPAAGRMRIFAVTGVEALDDAGQDLVFHLINQVQAHPGNALVTTGAQAPLALPLRPELRTRLGSGFVFRLHLLDDDDKTRVLRQIARQRGVRIAPEVLRWLLRHTSRDLRALVQLFNALDRHAFERQRAITLPLLRDWLDRAAAEQAFHRQPVGRDGAGMTGEPPEPGRETGTAVIMPSVSAPSTPDIAPVFSRCAGPATTGLALFDLDQTLLPIDSDFEWGRFLVGIGVVDGAEYDRRNQEFFDQYHAGTLDIREFLAFQLAPLAAWPAERLKRWRAQFLAEVIRPKILAPARRLVERHQTDGDLCAIVTATNEFVTRPIAAEFGIEHLIATGVECIDGRYTGRPRGTPSFRHGKIERTDEWLASLGRTWEGFTRTCFYSDSLNDLPLLERVSDPVATNPDPQLAALAQERGWRTLHLFA